MAHHKRGRPKSRRSGCLLCKPHKHQRVGKFKRQKPHEQAQALGARVEMQSQLGR